MYLQWRKDNGSTSSFWKLIIPHLLRFEKLYLSQFKLYIGTETTTHCFVCCNFQNTILIRYAKSKANVIVFYTCWGYILACESGVRQIYMNFIYLKTPFDIIKPCIKIAKSEVLFKEYRMALNWDKYDIEVRDDDAINRNWLLFDFTQQTFSCLDGLYMDENVFW